MPASRKCSGAVLVLFGAGLIGKFLGILLAHFPSIRLVRIIDRDCYRPGQTRPIDCGRPKAMVLAEAIRALNPSMEVDPIVADLAEVPLGLLRDADVFLTALDSPRARIGVNFFFQKLGIKYWIDAGVQAPSLARVAVFGRGRSAPCFECGLSPADYAADTSYPCQPIAEPAPTNASDFLGSLCASFQAGELAKLLQRDQQYSLLNQELVYDAQSNRQVVTRLTKRPDCGCGGSILTIRDLRAGPRSLSLERLARAAGAAKPARVCLTVPGHQFVRRLVCSCGYSREVLGLLGRFSERVQHCPKCSEQMMPQGFSMSSDLCLGELSSRELGKPLAFLGLAPLDVVGVRNGRTTYLQLAAE